VKKLKFKSFIFLSLFALIFSCEEKDEVKVDVCKEKESKALKGCEFIARQVHHMLNQCEYENKILENSLKQCVGILSGQE